MRIVTLSLHFWLRQIETTNSDQESFERILLKGYSVDDLTILPKKDLDWVEYLSKAFNAITKLHTCVKCEPDNQGLEPKRMGFAESSMWECSRTLNFRTYFPSKSWVFLSQNSYKSVTLSYECLCVFNYIYTCM